MDRFTVEILPVVIHFASVCFKCPDQQSLALTLAWFNWNRAKPEQQELPASVWARLGVRWVLAKRDLPGVGTSAKDALHRAESGGSMEGLTDSFPGPEQIAMNRERYQAVVINATDRERLLIDSFEAGEKAKDVAAKMGVSGSRVTQLRQGLMARDE
jgi:hypothetical protein